MERVESGNDNKVLIGIFGTTITRGAKESIKDFLFLKVAYSNLNFSLIPLTISVSFFRDYLRKGFFIKYVFNCFLIYRFPEPLFKKVSLFLASIFSLIHHVNVVDKEPVIVYKKL